MSDQSTKICLKSIPLFPMVMKDEREPNCPCHCPSLSALYSPETLQRLKAATEEESKKCGVFKSQD